MKNAIMKPSDSISNVARVPSLFQIAAFLEDFFPTGDFKPASAAVRQLPSLNLKTLLRSGNSGTATANPAPAKSQSPGKRKRSSRTAMSKKPAGHNQANVISPMPSVLKKVEFTLEAPWASSVKLAGDFTGWENQPVPMMHSPEGIWFTTVPLVPGQYSYRFIVDGKWYDDPISNQHIPNPFGTKNALINVA
jgi:hypothetical protein